MIVWQATLSTRNFDFEALGLSAEDARAALEIGLTQHAKQYRLGVDWWRQDYLVNLRSLEIGSSYRDREKLT